VRKSTEKGSVLIGVLILVIVVVMVMGAVASFITHGIQRTKATSARLQALYLAEAGVEKAIEQLKEDWDNTAGSIGASDEWIDFPSSGDKIGKYKFTINPQDEGSDRRIIEGHGKVKIAGREVEEKVEVEVVKIPEEPSGGGGGGLPSFDYALFAANSITMGSPGTIEGDVMTNATESGSVNLSSGSGGLIKGNLYIGSGANPDVIIKVPDAPGTYITESITNTEMIKYPPPEFPNYPTDLEKQQPITVEGSNNTETISEDGDYGSIIVRGATLYIYTGDEGDERVILVDNLEMSWGNARIVLQGSGKLKLYVRDKFDISNSGHNTINYGTSGEGDPARVTLYYGGAGEFNLSNDAKINGTVVVNDAKVVIGGSGALKGSLITGGDEEITVQDSHESMSGLIYAPNATVAVNNSGKVVGAVVCQNFKSVGGEGEHFTCLKYNGSILQDIEIPADVFPPPEENESEGGDISITSWSSGLS